MKGMKKKSMGGKGKGKMTPDEMHEMAMGPKGSKGKGKKRGK